jgi:serine/threonine-protein kinase
MGVTYLGRRGDDPTLYAVKVVKPSFQGSPGQINDFLRAARALVKLGHPHLIHLCEIGGCPSGFYFVSDYFPGQSAAEIVQRDGPFPIVRAVRWANQLLQALSYAHEKKFVHSDIKPANILAGTIDGKEVVKLADFAVARVYQAAPFSGLSVTASLLSLASFMPPELLFNYQDVNPLSDQYSIAAVLYHLLTGGEVIDLPSDERKKFSSVLRHQYTPLRERRADVPAALADAIHKALSRSPSQRFKDVAQFRQAILRAVQAG